VASFDELVARGASIAPLMKPGERVAAGGAVRFDRDGCVTVVYAANRPVRLWLEDRDQAQRGEASNAASGAVPPRGPACARRGEELRLVVQGGGDPTLLLRAIAFVSP
jgi:hypothetical protein